MQLLELLFHDAWGYRDPRISRRFVMIFSEVGDRYGKVLITLWKPLRSPVSVSGHSW